MLILSLKPHKTWIISLQLQFSWGQSQQWMQCPGCDDGLHDGGGGGHSNTGMKCFKLPLAIKRQDTTKLELFVDFCLCWDEE